jgi:hypothetical protein
MNLDTLEALAFSDRAAALARLVPGSDEADRFRILHHQQRGELAAAEALLEGWVHHRGATFRALSRRQRVLRAALDLPAHADALATELGVTFAHARRTTAAPEGAPSSWRLPSEAELVRLGRRADRGLAGLTDVGLRHAPLAEQRANHLQRLARGGVPGLVEALADALADASSKGFGSLPVHRRLLRDELERLAELAQRPALRTDREWVLEHLARHRPPAHVDLALDLDARHAWLDTAWGLVAGLPAAFADLRAQVLLQQLELDRRRDRHAPATLLEYLKIPRRSSPARQLEKVPDGHVAKLGADLSRWLGLPHVGDDGALLAHHVHAHLRAGHPADRLREGLDEDWLRAQEAEVALVDGRADAEHHARRLGAAAAALRDRVDVEILPHVPAVFGPDDAVSFDVAAKNAWPLHLRVYRADVAAAVAAGLPDVPADLDVEGLAPCHERALPGAHEPLRRVRLRVDVPECDRPGTWLVELEGNGRVARVVVRKGDLRLVQRTTRGGVDVVVTDAAGAPRPAARVFVGATEYTPDAAGTVHLPFGSGGPTAALLVDGDLAVPATVYLPAEAPALHLAAHVDRQALVPGRTTTLLLRPALTIAGAPAPLSALEDAFVEVNTLDRTGVPTSTRTPATFEDGEDLALSFAVPEHLAGIQVAVGGRVRVRSQQRHEPLRAEAELEVGDRATTLDTVTPALRPTPDGVEVWLVGRSGEPAPGRELTLRLRHRWLRDPLELALATDAQGRVALGPLPDVDAVEVVGPVAAAFPLSPPRPRRAPLAAFEGEEVVVAWAGPLRLVEWRGGAPALDATARVTRGEGVVRVRAPAGEYTLEGDDEELRLTVGVGPRPAHGALRLPRGWAVVPVAPAAEVTVAGDALRVVVAQHGPETRVHAWSTPFLPDPAGDPDLRAPATPPSRGDHAPRTTTALPARELGDEARYVRERRRAPGAPGTLLERPSLLLTPWALRTTHTAVHAAKPGQAWAAASMPAPAPPGAPRGGFGGAAAAGPRPLEDRGPLPGPWWDFLGDAGGAAINLVPGDDGAVEVPLAELPGSVVTVVVVDPRGSHRVTLTRPHTPAAPRDRRLAAPLPAGRWVESRRLTTTPGGGRAVAITALGPLYSALCALSGDPTLAAWDFLPRWAELPRSVRLDRWNEHACHELALFVAHRDPELFESVVRPFLANKLQPDLVDDLLVGRPLDRWLVPWRAARLDAVERALLARARPDARERLWRQLRDEAELVRWDPSRDDRLVDTLLGGSGETPPPAEQEAALLADGFLAESAEEADDEAPVEKAKKREAPRRSERSRSARADADERPADERWRPADLTKEWAEHQWYRAPLASRGPGRVTASRWWRDYAAHVDGPFLSPHLADAARSFTEGVVALAVVGVGGAAAGRWWAEAALSPSPQEPTGTLLVGQHLVRPDDRTAWDGGEEREKHVGDEVLTQVAYTGVVAVTNPTPRRRRVAVLVQIPAGAVALGGAVATRTTPVDLGPWATHTLETSFTFPRAGTFAWRGAMVADGAVVAAAAPDRRLEGVDVARGGDAESWEWISQDAPTAEVVAYLQRANLQRVALSDLAWRLRDRAAFDAITRALAAAGAYDADCWSYALLHRDVARTREWLDRHPLVDEVGPLSCALLEVDPTDRRHTEHLEYAPLVNARAHRLGAERRVLNDGQDAHWRRFLDEVATAPAPSPADHLRAAHHLTAMDRPAEAAAHLATVDPTVAPLQTAWLRATAATTLGDWAGAAALVAPHLEHPVPRWRARFRALHDDALGQGPALEDPDRRDSRQAALADRSPHLAARVEGQELVLDHAHVAAAQLRVHRMDVELLFSRQPFLVQGGGRFGLLEPAETATLTLSAQGPTRWPLPAGLRAAAIEVVAGPLRQVVTHLHTALVVTPIPAYGQLRVTRGGVPVAGAYVKVFARQRGGAVAFYKDGYTDRRGRFDHATLSTDDLSRTERFAVMVTHGDDGATILELSPP